ncbi:hypothetical protein [Simkania negevensis]|uniref:Uncharacterized protein n=1 Tax=Simkania negevensis (strain ATCC VR-1471 / DSM 27360 / Z) TaxID=331113 RepID=F8L9Q0_SIMNZ|nr:hypothetical protein [Simkania negevensis]CCB89589.1 putative uncharacterized protein [Simkania negevensis Z]
MKCLFKSLKKTVIGLAILLLGTVAWDLGHIAYYRSWFSNQLLSLPYTPQKAQEIDSLLSQTFTFIDNGSSSEVFASEDGQAVIKVFFEKPYTAKSRIIRPFNQLAALKKELKMKRKRCQACMNSYALLPQETGMIYYHLMPTNTFNRIVLLKNPDGTSRMLDLDKDAYYIQKKAEVTNHYLEYCVRSGHGEKAQQAITDLLDFTLLLSREGIVMVDLQFTSNFGFIKDVPVRIDIEHLRFERSWKKGYEAHLSMQLKDFRKWIHTHLPPEFLTYFDEEVARLKAEEKK